MNAASFPTAAEIESLLKLARKRESLLRGEAAHDVELKAIEQSMLEIIRRFYDPIGPPGSEGFNGTGPPGEARD